MWHVYSLVLVSMKEINISQFLFISPPAHIPGGSDDVGSVWLHLHQVQLSFMCFNIFYSIVFHVFFIVVHRFFICFIWLSFMCFLSVSFVFPLFHSIVISFAWLILTLSAPHRQHSVCLNCLHIGRWLNSACHKLGPESVQGENGFEIIETQAWIHPHIFPYLLPFIQVDLSSGISQ